MVNRRALLEQHGIFAADLGQSNKDRKLCWPGLRKGRQHYSFEDMELFSSGGVEPPQRVV